MQTDLELPEGIDPAVALQLAKHGGSLLCLDVPPGTQIGIDLATYTVGGKFKGIKMIPPGVHFVSFAAVSKEGDMAPRTGRFLWFQQGQVHAWRWNPATEDFLCGPELGEGEAERYAEGVRRFEFDQFLGTYPLKTYARWQTLSRYITKDLLSRTEPIGGKVASTQALLDGAGAAGSSSGMGSKQETKESELEEKKKALAEEALELEIRGGETLFLSAIPFTGAGVAPEKRTEFALDTSRSLLTLCSKLKGGFQEVLGELQMCFVCFFLGQSLQAFEQWKKLLDVLCRCSAAFVAAGDPSSPSVPRDLPQGIALKPQMFQQSFEVILTQVKEVPEDFFGEHTGDTNFLKRCAEHVAQTLREYDQELAKPIAAALSEFLHHCNVKFGWKFPTTGGGQSFKTMEELYAALQDVDEGEDPPVIVEP